MSNNPFFSVIIPTYNREKFICTAIESLLAQSFRDFEIIIVDDGSVDNTEEVVKKIEDNRLHYYKKENGERAAARNFGVKKAEGEYINFLDSDDTVYSNHLAVARKFCDENKNVEIFHLGFDVKNKQGTVLRSVTSIQSVNQEILSGNILSCNGVFVRKDVMLSNLFNEDRMLSSLEDWELWIRMSARYTFLNSNIITSSVIQHDDRSVMNPDPNLIKAKVDRFIFHVLQDKKNIETHARGLNNVLASVHAYASLHLAIGVGNKIDALRYLAKGLSFSIREILKKRFLVIIKKLAGF